MKPDGPACLIDGRVWHTRLRPKAHKLSYRVFALLLDVDRLDEFDRSCRLFSRNRFNLLSFHDRDAGARDGLSVADHARRTLADAGHPATHGAQISLLTYPRVLGYTFNPLSVYFCRDASGDLRSVIYEVSNTYGERISYVLSAGEARDGIHAHACGKAMDVSPFTPRAGARYDFRLRLELARLTVGVQLRDGAGALIKTHFSGAATPATDGRLIALCLRQPLMTGKVMAAIHYEALKLYLKGVPLVRRQPNPRYVLAGKVDPRG